MDNLERLMREAEQPKLQADATEQLKKDLEAKRRSKFSRARREIPPLIVAARPLRIRRRPQPRVVGAEAGAGAGAVEGEGAGGAAAAVVPPVEPFSAAL